jgi:hypothetical protein
MNEETNAVVTEDELLSKISDTENNFIERKTAKNTDGWLKTAVAFANSCPIGQPGILYVGVDNNGKVEKQPENFNFEKLQKSISGKIAEAWPPIYFVSHILIKDGLEFVAVVVWGSSSRPHFSGRAFVRAGPETRDASEEEYDKLIAQRSSKIRALEKLIGQVVYWHQTNYRPKENNGILVDCNQFYMTFRGHEYGNEYQRCFPIDWVTISYDPANRRAHLIVTAPL